ncbi:hypothetical protein [Halococcus saccharolyticus]|uniref:Uncharacterized protein n=1 Tax=Halococcus saccharolyticus DSM 5350 TaxID=1227455 RepID=M0MR86_9EURY|nr:hypothetical protein [Halococcus saccharolyticus]EMA47873.1 hypothetical protein C449_00335 [Halococcus saccharolyticus DSM 5350]
MPSVPDESLAESGWELTEDTTETVFQLSAVQVEGHTLVYEDADRREAIESASDGDLDGPWRFFFATRLTFRPPLAPGVGPTMIRPAVVAEARRTFVDRLEDRGFHTIDRGRTERMRTEGGNRARLTKYTARHAIASNDHDGEIAIEAWLAVWIHEGSFRIAGGAYPTQGFDSLLAALGVEYTFDPAADREELLGLLRAVE